MQFDFSPSALVRGGSGILFMLVGAAMLALGRGRRDNVATGIAAVAFGLIWALDNFLESRNDVGLRVGLLYVQAGLALVSGAGFAVPALSSRSARVFGGTVAVLLVGEVVAFRTPGSVAAYFGSPPREVWTALYTWILALRILTAGAMAYLFLLAGRSGRAPEPRERRSALLVALGWGIYPAFQLGGAVVGVPQNAAWFAYWFWTIIAVALAVVVGVLLHATRTNRNSRYVAWLLLACVSLGMMNEGLGGTSAKPWVGVARTVGAALIAYAILREGALGFDLALPTVRRGTLATTALAALFIVAQIAENYVDAQYGLLMGGVVAGALLFAAAPIQRAFEGPRTSNPRTAPSPQSAGVEDSYRKAVRLALRDRRLTREEETHLHELARDLGLDGARAHAILTDVEAASSHAKAGTPPEPEAK